MSSLKKKGCLIAFEGAPELVATQIRLLPVSPHILVLPAVQEYLGDAADLVTTASGQLSVSTRASFDARHFIRKVHEAACVRNRAAADFLRFPGTTTTTKRHEHRLVFLEGGTAASHALCVETLRKYDDAAGGDLQRAAMLFEELVAGGLAGLDASKATPQPAQLSRDFSSASSGIHTYANTDPSTRAMLAADRLDKETESLQPINENFLDLTIRPRRHSLSLPIHGDKLASLSRRVSQVSNRSSSSSFWNIRPGGELAECFLLSPLVSPTATLFPLSMQPAAIAAAMALASPTRRESRGRTRWRARSLERESISVSSVLPLVSMRGSPRERSISFLLSRDSSARPMSGMTVDSVFLLQRPRPLSAVTDMSLLSPCASGQSSGPDPTRQSPLPQLRLQVEPETAAKPAYVDRGTDAAGPFAAVSDPVLPLVEDLVVCFRDGLPHTVLDLTMARSRSMADHGGCIRDDTYRTSSTVSRPRQRSEPQGKQSDQTPYTPTTPPREFLSDSAGSTAVGTLSSPEEYHTFSPNEDKHSSDAKPPRFTIPSYGTAKTTDRTHQPPTPAQTPPPLPEEQQKKHSFLDFSVTGHQTAVAMQNALRVALRDHLKQQGDDDRQKNADKGAGSLSAYLSSANCGPWTSLLGADGSSVDLVLALGVQKGVWPAFTATVVDRLATLGATHSAARSSRSGRLDIRYLVATALQAGTALESPSNKALAQSLAALVVPQLDLYLRMHPSIRFLLLDYPVELLDVVLALQQLTGRSFLQVAALLVPRAGAAQVSSALALSDDRDSHSRADLVLRASTSELDIAAFVASVHRRLVGTSIPAAGDPLREITITVHSPSVEQPTSPTSPASVVSSISSTVSHRSQASTLLEAPSVMVAPARAVSMMSSSSRLIPKTVLVSGLSAALARQRRGKQMESMQNVAGLGNLGRSGIGGSEADVGNYGNDEYDDDDMDDDMDMRRLMPMFLRDQMAMYPMPKSAIHQSRSSRPATEEGTDEASNSGALRGVVRGRSMSDLQAQQARQAAADASTRNNSKGQKALKWLGLE